MIDSARVAQAQHEGYLLAGVRALIAGDVGPEAEAAGRLLCETVLMWRAEWRANNKQG